MRLYHSKKLANVCNLYNIKVQSVADSSLGSRVGSIPMSLGMRLPSDEPLL